MTMRLALALLCALAMSACTTPGLQFSGDRSGTCDKGPDGATKLIVINIKKDKKKDKKISKPERACARPGDILWFKVKVKGDKTVEVKGKNLADEWIEGRSDKGWFFVTVPTDVIEEDDEDGEDFEYSIFVDDFDDLDPEVRVRHSF